MSQSPKKKKMKKSTDETSKLKRGNETEGCSSKRSKSVKNYDDVLQAQKRKNFITACKQVSHKAFFDHRARLLLLCLPSCMNNNISPEVNEMQPHAEEAFMIDIRANLWCEALEVCAVTINSTQYLSANVLKEIVEIILNAHEDKYADNTVSYIIMKCQHILQQHFRTHPPSIAKRLRLCYNDFLTSPLQLKEKTFTNRNQFGYHKGLVKYCMNRLQYEISSDSIDEPLVNKRENIPEEMKQSLKGCHWQKEKFEIYELLERTERINRLMTVLESIVEVLQFDLAIWHSRYADNLSSRIMTSHKPLMAYILWSNNVVFTGAVNNNCRQILLIFAQMVHLQYPEKHIKTMIIWLNAVIQTIYISETNSSIDYPNTGQFSLAFANEFYKVIADMPHDSIVRILEMIKPAYMKSLIGSLHLKKLLSTEEDSVIKNLIDFVKHSKWTKYPQAEGNIQLSKNLFPKPRKNYNIMKYLTKSYSECSINEAPENVENFYYPKMASQLDKHGNPNCNNVVQTLYITLKAYLDKYSVLNVQKTLDSLNKNLVKNDDSSVTMTLALLDLNSYTVTEQFIKKYRSIYQNLKDLVLLLQELKTKGELPEIFKIFDNISLLGL